MATYSFPACRDIDYLWLFTINCSSFVAALSFQEVCCNSTSNFSWIEFKIYPFETLLVQQSAEEQISIISRKGGKELRSGFS